MVLPSKTISKALSLLPVNVRKGLHFWPCSASIPVAVVAVRPWLHCLKIWRTLSLSLICFGPDQTVHESGGTSSAARPPAGRAYA